MRFEWNEQRDQRNTAKHGISFEEARGVFEDPLHVSLLDHRFNYFEERWIAISGDKGIVVAAHLYFDDDDEEVVRIISARRATKQEVVQYER